MNGLATKEIVVLKLGGSVFKDPASYRQAAEFLCRRLASDSNERWVVVVSAQEGLTDTLESEARAISSRPSPRTLDLLWSTGEIRSVALLTLHLEAFAVPARGLSIHETGLTVDGTKGPRRRVEVFTDSLREALAENAVVVVPGFLATERGQQIVSLGRGGSDLTAVVLAQELRAARCELIKDVPGYFTEDPHVNPRASQIPSLSYDDALEMADRGCDLVQKGALKVAKRTGLPLVVRGFSEEEGGTMVSNEPAFSEKDALVGEPRRAARE